MTFPTHYEKNTQLDALLILAFMSQTQDALAIQRGMKPDELYGRREWLRTQSPQYIKAVSDRAAKIERDRWEKAKRLQTINK